jgi:predicted site-specific integrase-resolvase
MAEPLQMSPERMIEALNNQVRLITAERDGLASVLKDVRDELVKERKMVKGLLDAILEHLGASIEYE